MTTADHFDVVIPAYNAQHSIQRAIRSAFEAGASNVIVVDDGSSDGTAELARREGATVQSQANAGASIARRRGLALATSDFVVLLDADDALVPAGVAHSLSLLEVDEQLAAVGGAALGESPANLPVLIAPSGGRLSTEVLVAQGYSPVPPACFVWRLEQVRRASGDMAPAPLRPRYAEDYELLVRGAMLGGIVTHRRVTSLYSLSGGKSTIDPSRSIRASSEIRSHYAQHLGLNVPRWTERQVAARVSLRRSKDVSSHVSRLRLVVKASLLDPALIMPLVRSKLRRAGED